MWAAPHRPTPHTRAERDLVERHAVAAHGGLGLGSADDVVPGILVEVGARLADELVQVLEGFAAGAKLGIARWPDRFVHLVSPGLCWVVRCSLAYRFPRLHAIPNLHGFFA